MIEAQNLAIKLFGQRIKLPPLMPDGVSFPPLTPPFASVADAKPDEYGEETEQDLSDEGSVRDNGKVDDPSQQEQELTSSDTSHDSVNPKTPSIDEDISKTKESNTDGDNSPKSQDKPLLKKPDKILPCPRCNSMDTKFCYYNNYNVNQPRHFCKACQRYWTAGGTMRNVPVGAGRRKSKSSASQYRHITISEVLQAAARVDVASRTHHHYPNLTPKGGTVLTFGANQYDPMTAPVEKRAVNGIRNGSLNHGSQSIGAKTVSRARVETRDERSSETFPGKLSVPNNNGFVPQVPSLSSVPWPYAMPIPFYPTGFWACSNVSVPAHWHYPLIPPPAISQNLCPNLCPNSQILGKRPRDGDTTKADCSSEPDLEKPRKNGSVLIPKTLRIDDPTDAAKSSIWATLGIKSECGMFKGFKSTGSDKVKDRAFEGELAKDRISAMTKTEDSRVLFANPAALSRSLNFHESS